MFSGMPIGIDEGKKQRKNENADVEVVLYASWMPFCKLLYRHERRQPASWSDYHVMLSIWATDPVLCSNFDYSGPAAGLMLRPRH